MSSQLSDSHQVTGFIGTLSDITARMEADTKLKSYMRDLERINAELDQFAYVVSHDLKAPLRAINNLSEWIEEDIGDLLEGDTKDQFRLLRGRVHRMESLINGILSYSRAGRIKTTKERFLVKSLVDDLCDTFSSKKPVEFILEGDQKLELVTEKITLGQILQNLISNGIKYNDKPEIKITIGWKELDEGHEFFVKDNGPGISPEFHDKIFVIFQTLQARDEVESTGVGLAIVKKIMDEKGAKIRIESTMSSGTTFYFTWPGNEV
jgi:light-regulated signal transduction histidine kinase (bacteriophytochrome)